MVTCQTSNPEEADHFSALDLCCYMRKAVFEGREGFALIDSDGGVELFTENRSDIFFYIHEHELTFVLLN